MGRRLRVKETEVGLRSKVEVERERDLNESRVDTG